jgi:hypothetical protein
MRGTGENEINERVVTIYEIERVYNKKPIERWYKPSDGSYYSEATQSMSLRKL